MENTMEWYSVFWAVEITAFVAIVVMCVLIYSLRQNTLTLNLLREQDDVEVQRVEERFNGEQAEKWFEKGELQNLTHYCEQFIQDSPNSVHANWYYALSRYNEGEYEIAREYFENVIRINPLWREGATVYLQEIAAKIGFSNSQTLH